MLLSCQDYRNIMLLPFNVQPLSAKAVSVEVGHCDLFGPAVVLLIQRFLQVCLNNFSKNPSMPISVGGV